MFSKKRAILLLNVLYNSVVIGVAGVFLGALLVHGVGYLHSRVITDTVTLQQSLLLSKNNEEALGYYLFQTTFEDDANALCEGSYGELYALNGALDERRFVCPRFFQLKSPTTPKQ